MSTPFPPPQAAPPPAQGAEPPQETGSESQIVELNEEQQAWILEIVESQEEANRMARLEEIRRVQLNREFYRGNQNIFWNADARRWQKVSSTGLQTKSESDVDKQRYDYVINIYAANVDTTVAFLSAQVPKVRFIPQSSKDEDDVITAEAASKIARYIEDNNKIDQLRIQQCFLLCTDGGCASYTRYVVDGERFGYDSVPVVEEVPGQVTPETMQCPNCGNQTPLADDWHDTGEVPTECDNPGCPGQPDESGQPQPTLLSPANIQPPQMGMVPQTTGYRQQPRGAEVITIVGLLEVQRPYFAQSQADMPWWSYEIEVPKSKLRTVYPAVAHKIAEGESSGSSPSGSVGRDARISLAATATGRWVGGGYVDQLVTFRRCWIRPWAFFELEDEERAGQLAELFPNGAYVALAGSTVCEARSENPDKFWAFMHARPGVGQMREGISHHMIDVQRRYNIESNILTETIEYGIPTRFIDPAVVDLKAYKQQGAVPGMFMPAIPKAGARLSDSIWDTPAPSVSPAINNHMQWMFGEESQMVTGNFPALFGGQTGANDTATGITIARDQAAGRMGLFMIALRDFWSRTMMNAVDCFRTNRTEDVEAALLGAAGEFETELIHLDDLRGGLYARADADEAIPRTWSDRRSAAMKMLESQNPQFQALLLRPENVEILESAMGVDDLYLPGEDARAKQLRQIQVLLESAPMPGPMDPMTGQQAMLPTVPVDEILDDNGSMLATIQEWANSPEGQQAQEQNPNGYANVRAQAQVRSQMIQQAQMTQQMAAPQA